MASDRADSICIVCLVMLVGACGLGAFELVIRAAPEGHDDLVLRLLACGFIFLLIATLGFIQGRLLRRIKRREEKLEHKT